MVAFSKIVLAFGLLAFTGKVPLTVIIRFVLTILCSWPAVPELLERHRSVLQP